MDCPRYVEWIALELEGTLSGERRGELRAHLDGCGRCRAELLLQERMNEALAEEPAGGLPADFTARVTGKILEPARPEKRPALRSRLVPVLAVAAAMVPLVYLIRGLSRALSPVTGALPSTIAGQASGIAGPIIAFYTDAALSAWSHILNTPVIGEVTAIMIENHAALLVSILLAVFSASRVRAFLRE